MALNEQQLGNISSIGNTGSGIVSALNQNTNGKKNVALSALGGGLKGAAIGANPALVAATGGLSIAAGALAGGIISGISSSSANKKLSQQEADLRELEGKRKAEEFVNYSKNLMSNYPRYGVETNSLYMAKGGKIPNYKLGVSGIKNINKPVVVKGNSHVDGGVPLFAKGKKIAEVENKEVIYESKDGNLNVLSDQLGIAPVAKKYMNTSSFKSELNDYNKQKEKIEDFGSKARSGYQLNTYKRNMDKLNHPLDALYDYQENNKEEIEMNTKKYRLGGPIVLPQQKGISYDWFAPEQGQLMGQGRNPFDYTPDLTKSGYVSVPKNKDGYITVPKNTNTTYLEGGRSNPLSKFDNIALDAPSTPLVNLYPDSLSKPLGKTKLSSTDLSSVFDDTLPFIDNIVNARLTNNTPNIPQPEYLDYVNLKTDYNIQPQLATAKQGLRNLNKNLDNSFANPQTSAANKSAAYAQFLNNTSEMNAQKQNIETQLINQNRLNTQGIRNQNKGLLNDYNWKKLLRASDIQDRKSANAANLSEDLQGAVRNKNLRNYDNKSLELIRKKYKNTGVLDRAGEQENNRNDKSR